MKRFITIAFILSLASLVAYAGERVPIRVYIIQPGSNQGFVDQNSKALSDSTEDLTNALEKKGKTIAFVWKREVADITLEVISRGMVDSGKAVVRRSRSAWGSRTAVENSQEEEVSVRLICGEYTTVINGRSLKNTTGQVFNVWKAAADSAAAQIDRWVKDNYDKIMSGKQ